MTNVCTTSGLHEPFDQATAEDIVTRFQRDGFVHIPRVLGTEEIEQLKTRIDDVFEDPRYAENCYGPYVAVRLFEIDRMFRDMLVREPLIGLAEHILGANCHIMAENVVRNRPGEAIDTFHVDDVVEFPTPEDMQRHDPRLTMPVFRMTIQMLLTDVSTIERGPSQYVPGSHYSGKQPNDKYNPTFEGKGPVSVFCKPGDVYLHNGQCWHRGAPNTSDVTRYLMQMSFSVRWVAQRFYPFLNYRMPDHVLEGASDRLLRVLGKHPRGPYG